MVEITMHQTCLITLIPRILKKTQEIKTGSGLRGGCHTVVEFFRVGWGAATARPIRFEGIFFRAARGFKSGISEGLRILRSCRPRYHCTWAAGLIKTLERVLNWHSLAFACFCCGKQAQYSTLLRVTSRRS